MFPGAVLIEQLAGVVTLTVKAAALVKVQLVAAPPVTADKVTELA